jgi:predicted TIM-barrel fold metal-dependent hydrolase
MDNLKPVIEGFAWLTEADRNKIFELNARRLYRF